MSQRLRTVPSLALIAAMALAAPALARDLIVIDGPIKAKDVKCNGCVGRRDIGNDAVGSGELKNDAVTSGKLGNNAVTRDKIRAGAVGPDEIQDGAVTEPKIQDGAVSARKLAPGDRVRRGRAKLILGTASLASAVRVAAHIRAPAFGPCDRR